MKRRPKHLNKLLKAPSRLPSNRFHKRRNRFVRPTVHRPRNLRRPMPNKRLPNKLKPCNRPWLKPNQADNPPVRLKVRLQAHPRAHRHRRLLHPDRIPASLPRLSRAKPPNISHALWISLIRRLSNHPAALPPANRPQQLLRRPRPILRSQKRRKPSVPQQPHKPPRCDPCVRMAMCRVKVRKPKASALNRRMAPRCSPRALPWPNCLTDRPKNVRNGANCRPNLRGI